MRAVCTCKYSLYFGQIGSIQMADADKRKRKYKQQHFGKKKWRSSQHPSLEPGFRGFIITCNNDERKALMESYRLLNNHAETLGLQPKAWGLSDSSDDDETGEDISESVKRQCSQASSSKGGEYLFKQVRTKLKNCIFVRTTMEDTSSFLHSCLVKIQSSGTSKCQVIQRILPVEFSCKTGTKELTETIEELLKKHFSNQDSPPSYGVFFKSRCQSQLTKDTVVEIVGDVMKNLSPLSKVDLTEPDKAIIVEMLINVCCLSVVEDYAKLRRYNIQQIVEGTQTKEIE